MRDLRFGEFDMKNKSVYEHHYASQLESDMMANPKKFKRLVQEIGSLSNGLPLSHSSTVFLRVDSDRMDIMKCIITGPVDTPYDNGCFIFDIYIPPEYPNGPPQVNLETNGNETVRFNPNLYENGKVCLSLLGTWSGGANEKWNEQTSTLEQVLVSIQSLILVEKPYFNEPSYESSMNTAHGDSASTQYNEVIKIGAIQWAMIDNIKNPRKGFEDVIIKHFTFKRQEIMDQMIKWLEIAKTSEDSNHHSNMLKFVKELYQLLSKLDGGSPLTFEYDPDKKEETPKGHIAQLKEIIPGLSHDLYEKHLSEAENNLEVAIESLLNYQATQNVD